MDELLCKRNIASAVLTLALGAASVALADDGVVYVGDLTAAQASSPKLPTLGGQTMGSPTRQGSSRQVAAPQGAVRPTLFQQPAPRTGAALDVAPEAKPKGLFARMGWFDGDEQAAPQAPAVTIKHDPRVQPAQYTRNERSPGVRTRQGDQRTGLLSGLFSDDSDKAPAMPQPRQAQQRQPQSISKQQLAHEPLTQRPTMQPNGQPSAAGRPAVSLADATGRPTGPVGMPLPMGRSPQAKSADTGVVFATDSPKPLARPDANPVAEPEAVFVSDTAAPAAPARAPALAPALAPERVHVANDLLPKRLSPPSFLDNTPAPAVAADAPVATASTPQRQSPMVVAQPAAAMNQPAAAINNAFAVNPPQAALPEQTVQVASIKAESPVPASLANTAAAPTPQPVPAANSTVAALPNPVAAHPAATPADILPAPREFHGPAIVLPNPVAVQAPEPQQPSDRAVALLTEANAVSQRAVNEADLTEVVQRCRHVLAIDHSEPAVAYANQLAAWALNKRGELRADAGRGDLAMNDFEDALRMDAGQWRALHNRGVLMAQQGAYAEAFEAFNRTISLNGNFAKAFSNRAALYVQAGDLASAMRDFQRSIEIDPDLAVAHKGRGRVCHMLGKMDESLQHLDAAMILTPGDAQVASSRADLLMDMGRYAQAIEGYRQAIALDATLPTPYRNLAWLQATCPDPAHRNGAEAVAHARRAIELSPEVDDISLDTLAAAQAAAGDFAGAVETLGQAIVIAPATDADGYAQRLALYQAGQSFTTEPVAPVRTASYLR